MCPENFWSVTETDAPKTPHALYEALAVDAALLELNEILPTLNEAEFERITLAAAVAAQTVLRMAHVPNRWLEAVKSIMHQRTPDLRDETRQFVYEHTDDLPRELRDEMDTALSQLHKAVGSRDRDQVRHALQGVEIAYWGHSAMYTEKAFALGFQLARDPSPLIFREVDHE